jgi:hypothetical protein
MVDRCYGGLVKSRRMYTGRESGETFSLFRLGVHGILDLPSTVTSKAVFDEAGLFRTDSVTDVKPLFDM